MKKIIFITVSDDPEKYKSLTGGLIEKTREIYKNELQIESFLMKNGNNTQWQSMSKAYNYAIKQFENDLPDLFIFCHDDIFSSEDNPWKNFWQYALNWQYGVGGIVARYNGEMTWAKNIEKPISVQTLDECFLAIRPDIFYPHFDERFNHWHQYGADICLEALSRGLKNYIFPCKLEHRGGKLGIHIDGDNFRREWIKLCEKWKDKFPQIERT